MPEYLKIRKPRTIRYIIKALYNPQTKHNRALTQQVRTYPTANCKESEELGFMYKCRSFDALYEIVKTYFPNTTPKEVFLELTRTKIQNDHYLFKPVFATCPGIQRIVFYYLLESIPQENTCSFNGRKYQSKWSWAELAKMCNFKNMNDVWEYRRKNLK